MAMATDTMLDPRIRAWLLAEPVPVRAKELGGANCVTLYRWLSGRNRPRGAMLALVMLRVEAWETAQREAAKAPRPRRAKSTRPEARPWAQGSRGA